jgi:hypothetical protein
MKLLVILANDNDCEIWINAIETIERVIKDQQLLEVLLSILIEYEIQNK